MDKRIRVVFDRQKAASMTTEGTVEVIVTIKGTRVYVGTGAKLKSYQWKDGEVVSHPDSMFLNQIIQEHVDDCEKILIGMEFNREPMRADIFKTHLPERTRHGIRFMVWLKQRIKHRNLREGTRKGHMVTYRALERFGKFQTFADITLDNIYIFDMFLREEKDPETGVQIKRTQAAIHNYHKRFKSYVTEAYRIGLLCENPYTRFVDKRGENGERPHLDKQQVKKLIKMRDQSPNSVDNRYLDFFLFQIFTGMAFTDASKFCYKEHVIDIDGHPFIHSRRIKTGEEFVVPILPYTQKILERTGNKPAVPSIQKYNQYLKGIGLALGCQFPISSHVARHTFACTIILGEGVPKEVLQVMMGHASIKTTEIYAKLPLEFMKRNLDARFLNVWK
ncbi:MAG: tyrosine-type recombinase/integrase [Prevotella sp.]